MIRVDQHNGREREAFGAAGEREASSGHRVRKMADRLYAMADSLDLQELWLPISLTQTFSQAAGDAALATMAMGIYRGRQRRSKHLKAQLFSDPAWDILLGLFIHTFRNEPVSTADICEAANVSISTGQRWLKALQSEGLIEMRATEDNRLDLVDLTNEGYEAMRNCMGEYL